uniref:Troponin I4a n=1 Tax=Sinocyclocheilus anshuiensis TaxID=1608454 RepID=A0A671SUX0_9TELE
MNYDIGHVSINILYYLCSNGCFNRSPQPKQKPKITSAHRLGLKIRLLNTALAMLKVEKQDKEKEREQVLSERVPPLHLSSLSVQELQHPCRDLHHKIDVIDEERYDIAIKVSKNDKEIQEINQKIYEMKSKLKRPNLKRVKLHTQSIDFKANLKTVKKEEEKKEEVTDWRKNVEAMSGMEGRKKLFDAGQ